MLAKGMTEFQLLKTFWLGIILKNDFYVEFWYCSPPPSLPNSQPPTREASPAPLMMGNNARTPPPKRWKRSFDMAHPGAPARKDGIPSDQPLSLVRLLTLSVLPTIWNRLIYVRNLILSYYLIADCRRLFSQSSPRLWTRQTILRAQ